MKTVTISDKAYIFDIFNDNDLISYNINRTGIWDKYITHILLELYKLGLTNTFIDIGANIGYFSILSAPYCKNVIAFEPNSICVNKFKNSILHNNFNNIQLNAVACGLTNEVKQLVYYTNNIGAATLNKDMFELKMYIPILKSINKKTVDINVINMHHYLTENSIENIDILKIDTEGHEYEILKSIEPYFKNKQVNAVIIELSPMWEKDIYSIDIIHFLKDCEYNYIYYLGSNDESITDLNTLKNNITYEHLLELNEKLKHTQYNLLYSYYKLF